VKRVSPDVEEKFERKKEWKYKNKKIKSTASIVDPQLRGHLAHINWSLDLPTKRSTLASCDSARAITCEPLKTS